MTGRYAALRDRALLIVAFVRERVGVGYRVVMLAGNNRLGHSIAAEVRQLGSFDPIGGAPLRGPTVVVRTPPLFLMRGWLS